MLIVLEGCDGTGKTHLAKQLITELSLRDDCKFDPAIVKRGVPEQEDMYEEYALDWYTPGQGRHFVLDRWHLGEWIYGRLYRGGSQLGTRGIGFIDRRLETAGALKLIIDNDISVVRERLAVKDESTSRPQDQGYLKTHHIAHVLDEYRMAAQFFGWVKITSDADPKSLIEWAASEEARVCSW